jgi:hypothetical protein
VIDTTVNFFQVVLDSLHGTCEVCLSVGGVICSEDELACMGAWVEGGREEGGVVCVGVRGKVRNDLIAHCAIGRGGQNCASDDLDSDQTL